MTFDNIQDFLHHFIDENYKYDILYLSDGALYKELYNVAIANEDKPQYQTLLGYLFKYGEAGEKNAEKAFPKMTPPSSPPTSFLCGNTACRGVWLIKVTILCQVSHVVADGSRRYVNSCFLQECFRANCLACGDISLDDGTEYVLFSFCKLHIIASLFVISTLAYRVLTLLIIYTRSKILSSIFWINDL